VEAANVEDGLIALAYTIVVMGGNVRCQRRVGCIGPRLCPRRGEKTEARLPESARYVQEEEKKQKLAYQNQIEQLLRATRKDETGNDEHV
jgi:hypothetical protein